MKKSLFVVFMALFCVKNLLCAEYVDLDPDLVSGRYIIVNTDDFDGAALNVVLNKLSWALSVPHFLVKMQAGKITAQNIKLYAPILRPLLKKQSSLDATISYIQKHFTHLDCIAIANEYIDYYLSFGGAKDDVECVHELTAQKLGLPTTMTIKQMVNQLKKDSELRAEFDRVKYETLIGMCAMYMQLQEYKAMA